LRLTRVLASLTPNSLWKKGFEQLLIDQPELDIRRRKVVLWVIAGLLTGSALGGCAAVPANPPPRRDQGRPAHHRAASA
jgi:hypothetical protein